MRAVSRSTLRHELIGLAGVVERNVYLIKRYICWDVAFFVWTVANTLTIVFIAKGIEASGGSIDVERATTTLLIGAVVWAYLGIIFEILTETVAWERWEGTIEYTFMAPLSRADAPGRHRASSPCSTGSSARSCCSSSSRCSSASRSRRELRRGARDPHRRVGLVLRDRDDDRRPAADLAGEGGAARLRRAGDAARRLGRLLPGRRCCRSGCSGSSTISPATYALDGIRAAILDGAALGVAVARHLAAA